MIFDLNKTKNQWLLLIALSFIWGTAFLLMKKGLESFSNVQVAGLRIFISFLAVSPLIIRSFKRINRKNITPLIIVGFIGNGLPALFFATAQTEISSSLAGMLNSLTPLFTVVVGILFFQSRVLSLNIIGIIIGLVGACILALQDVGQILLGNNWYSLLIILATMFYGTNINIVKHYLKDLSGLDITALALLFIGPIAGFSLLFTDFDQALSTPNVHMNFLYIVILSLTSSALAMMGINILIKYTSPVFCASVTYIIPVFAIFWGVVDGEVIRAIDIVGISLIIAGVYMVNKRSSKIN